MSVGCFPRDLRGSERGGRSAVPSLSSKFVVPSEAEPVLSQSDLRYSVSLSLVGKTVRFLKVKMMVKGDR